MSVMDFVPLLVVGALVAFGMAHQRLRKAAQPLRLEMAEKGEKLLHDDRVGPELRSQIEFMLNSAFSMRTQLLVGIGLFPIMVLVVIFAGERVTAGMRKEYRALPLDLRAQFAEVHRLHDRIKTANHPLLSMVIELLLAGVLQPIVLLRDAIWGRGGDRQRRHPRCTRARSFRA